MTFDVTKFVKERNAFLVTHARSSISTIFKMRFYLDGRVGSQMKPKIIFFPIEKRKKSIGQNGTFPKDDDDDDDDDDGLKSV